MFRKIARASIFCGLVICGIAQVVQPFRRGSPVIINSGRTLLGVRPVYASDGAMVVYSGTIRGLAVFRNGIRMAQAEDYDLTLSGFKPRSQWSIDDIVIVDVFVD